ncbi:MAG: NUDIX domain-containing protein [Bacilli bacterium]|nr:NUDIX domain-containing protein [Bacilli bacterium]
MKKEKSCGAIIYEFENEEIYILLLKHNQGHWSFPKGHMEKNETEYETAVREVKEETNLEVEINEKYRYISSYNPEPNVSKEVIFFLGKAKTNDIKAQETEISDIKWYKYPEILSIITHEKDKKILKRAINDISSLSSCKKS